MIARRFHKCWRNVPAAIAVMTLCACSGLRTASAPFPTSYALDGPPKSSAAPATQPGAHSLLINPIRAAAGFDSSRIVYVREAHRREQFANSVWIDPPARMLAPLMVSAVERSGAFRAVGLTPSASTATFRLDTELIRLQQEFGHGAMNSGSNRPAGPGTSNVRLTLRAYLVEYQTRQVIASRQFEAAVPCATDDPQGGVLAANLAVDDVLSQLSAFLAEAVLGWKGVP